MKRTGVRNKKNFLQSQVQPVFAKIRLRNEIRDYYEQRYAMTKATSERILVGT